MENKKILVDNMLCVACLCIGRTLHDVTDYRMQQCYLETLNEIPLCDVPQVCPSICWECIARLKKAVQFKEQVKDSYRILQTYTSENMHECLLSDITRTPRLKVHNTDLVSIPGSDAADKKSHDVQLVYLKEEMKNETKNDESDDVALSEDDRPLSVSSVNIGALEVEIENLIHKRGKKRKKTADEKVKKAKKIAKRLKSEKKLKQHLKTKAEQKIVTIELSYEDMLLEREREATRESYVKSEYKCESCLLGFNYLKSYEAHVTTKHSVELGDYSCPICKTVISSVESFTAHYKRHMRRYECSICHKRTQDMKVMQQHYYSTHEISLKEYKCNLCGKISNSVDTHRYHKDSHKARVPCPDCDKTFSHRAGLMNHRLTVHEFHNEFPCTVCDKVFRWKNSLKRHLEKHDLKSNQSLSAAFCSPCGISFSSVSSHQRHLRTSLKHVTAHELRFICDPCGRRFADKTKLRDHIEEKHLHRTYQCSICLKPSKNRVGLDQHVRNVHKGRPNNKICHHCGKGFPTKVQLESHIRSHTGEKPFICEFCPTTFSQQSNLYKHNRQVHLNIKSKRYPITKKRKVGALEAPAEPYQRPLLQYSPERGFVM